MDVKDNVMFGPKRKCIVDVDYCDAEMLKKTCQLVDLNCTKVYE